jgi:methionyl aminopeptidase
MSVETEHELAALRAAGRVVAAAIRAMRRAVRPGVTTAELDAVGGAARAATLAKTARLALDSALGVASAGAPMNAIGATVARTVSARGHAVCSELTGHGIGRRIHEPPSVPNVYVAALDQPLTPGLVMTIEPIISAGSGDVVETADGWTIRTADNALSAHAEHTIVVTSGDPIVLTR